MQRKFLLNLILLMVLNFLIKPFWIFGIDRTVQNTLPSSDYGIYFALFNFSMLFSILLDLGLTNYNNKNIAQHQHLLSKYFSGLLMFKFLLVLVYFAITFAVGFIVGYDSQRFTVLLFLSFNQALVSLILFLRSNVSAIQKFGTDSLLSVLDKFLMIVFCGIVLWSGFFKLTIHHFILSQTLAYLITLIVVFLVVYQNTTKFKFSVNFSFVLATLKQTYPYALLVLAMSFYYRLDAIMLDLMLPDGEQQVAIYAQAYRLLDASSQIGVLFASLLLPMFAYMIKQKEELHSLIKLSFSLLFIPASVLAIFVFFYASTIVELLYQNNSNETSSVLSLLMMCFVAIATTYIFGTLLTSNGSLKQLNVISIIGLGLNFLLNLILIPKYKAEGAAFTSLITQIIVVLLQLWVCKLIFDFKINLGYLLKIAGVLVVAFVITYVLKNSQINFIWSFFILLLVSGVLVFILKIIQLKELYLLIKNKK